MGGKRQKRTLARVVPELKSMRSGAGDVERVELPLSTLKGILGRAGQGPLGAQEVSQLELVVDTLAYMTWELERRGTSIARLKQMLFGATTESLRNLKKALLLAGKGTITNESQSTEEAAKPPEDKPKRKGHGRRGAKDFVSAEQIGVPHPELTPGTCCPGCQKGKVYRLKTPVKLLQIRAMAPLEATVYEQERLRCNGCGTVYAAPLPEGVKNEKFDETVTAMVGQLRYGAGLPFTRIERLVEQWGVPLAATTQWQLVRDGESTLAPVLEALLNEAANGELLHNDDTSMRVLERDELVVPPGAKPGARSGVYTSAVVSVTGTRKVALFMTGLKHAGENLNDVLSRRRKELDIPLQMCDALSHNTKGLGPTGEYQTTVANCLAHGRRQLVEVAHNFPDECLYMLEKLAKVYHHDAQACEQQLTPQARLALHQEKSGPLMTELADYMETQLTEHRVEPNSGLGEAFGYLRRHWPELTLFLRVAGAPLDNNLCERVLKRAILHRRNSLFYKTATGARIGDLYMSLIHTAELNGANPFDYLVTLLRNPGPVQDEPSAWLPWNYRDTLAAHSTAA